MCEIFSNQLTQKHAALAACPGNKIRRRLFRATARVPKPALDHQSVVLTARRCVLSWSSHAVCGALSGGESELYCYTYL